MVNQSKGFIHFILVLILGLVVLAGIGYLAYKNGQIRLNSSNSPLDSPAPIVQDVNTTSWKTYTNSKYGFEFEYPSNWALQETPLKITDPTNAYFIFVDYGVVEKSHCQIVPLDTPRCEKVFAKEGLYFLVDWGENQVGPFQTYVNNPNSSQGVRISMTVNHDIPAGIELTTEQQETFKKILSTFRFLE